VLAFVLVGLASAPAWLPVVLTRVAPGAGQRILDATARLIAGYGRQAIVALLSFAGLLLGRPRPDPAERLRGRAHRLP
jgi:hypothetical protein